jgi:hypothetical protein
MSASTQAPSANISISEAIDALSLFDEMRMLGRLGGDAKRLQCHYFFEDFSDSMNCLKEKVKACAKGLCLDCLCNGKKCKRGCRMPHD